jgi:hypothetical protein
MPKRNIPTNVENLLINNEPFEYAHLVKFERPFNPKDGEFRTGANRYVYLTDGARDISYDGNIYRAHRLQSVGNYSETTVARATNMSLTLLGEDLGLSYTFKGSQSGATLTAATTGLYDGSEEVDFVEAGFREGDKVKIVKTNGQNYSNGDSQRIFIISAFSSNNQVITLARTGTDTDDSTLETISAQNLTMTLENEELSGATLERGINASNPLFTNREVFVHKIFFDAEGVEKGAIQVFKGIIASTSISEASTGSRIKWGLTSHWGDFVQVGGRLTLDEVHRSLDSNGKPSIDSAVKPSYATDLGFQHAETSLNTIANYKTTETRTVMKSKKRGGIGKLTGERKYYEVQEQYDVDHQVDLNVHLKGRHLPVVYGVQRVPGIPVFADTKNNNSKEVYVAYALAEGKVQGLYNMYFEGSPIICTDESDFEVRNSVNGTERAETQLQCYGRADRGDTLSGSALTGALATATDVSDFDLLGGEASVDYIGFKQHSYASRFAYNSVNENNISGLLSTASSKGLQTSEYASISSPFDMFFTFHQGSSDQSADDSLVTIAESNGFKIQNDYYTGSQPYWSPNHRLLDTAYTVMKFTIEADQTTIPEVEYVIRGKVLECHNYDGTFVQDKVLGASDAATNFKNGSTCNVEVSLTGASNSWITIEDDATPFDDTGTDKVFRVVHNYSYYNSDGVQETRIRLDSIPNLNYGTDGIATYPYVRLKSGSNNWHMLSHNAGTVSTAASFPDLFIAPSSMSTNSSGVLSATFTTTNANSLKNVFGSNTETVYNIGNLTGTVLEGNENTILFGTWSGNTITFRGTFTVNATISGVKVASARVYDLSSNSSINALTSANGIVGETVTIVETGEQRTVTSFDTTNKYVSLDAPFTQVVTTNNTFTINGKGKDLRASTNPAIQTLDYITNKRYGKDLNRYTELDLPSFKASALLCDTRSDVTLTLTGNQSCVKGDVYKLVDTQSNHVASGQVLANTSSSNTVTFTAVSGKFFRQYFNYVLYTIGDFVIHEDKVYEVTTAGFNNTAPTHSSGTTNGFKYLSSVALTRESGTGPSSLSLAVNGTLPQYSLYDSDFIKYWRYLGWESHDQEWVTRHQTNFTLDTSKSIFANVNALLSHFNGILTYSNGRYELNVETQVDAPVESISDGVQSNPLHIKNEDIIGNISLVDNTQRTSKNTIKASLPDPQNNWGSRSISFFNSDFLKADRNVVKTGSFPFTGITNYYNGRINVEKELIQSRFSKEISFTVGQRGLLLKAGEVISISYSPFNFTNKRFRVENLTFNANCTVSVKAREYDDSIYAITPQRASIAHAAQTGANPSLEKPGAPTSLSTTNNKPGVITVSWNNATDFSAASDYTEIFRHTSDSQANATLLATISDAVTFNDVVADAGTFYYWVRHKRNSKLTNTNKTAILEGDYNASAGVSGVAKTLSAQLDIDVSSMQVKFNASGDLSPTGSAQDVLLTATLRNLTPNSSGVVFSIVNSDQTSQGVVKFTNGSTTLTDTSSPYQATVDASTVLNNTTNKFIKITTTDVSGEVFTELVPLTITRDGSSGSIGKDAAAVSLVADTNTIVYSANDADSEDPSNQSVTVTAIGLGISGANTPFSGTPTYTFSINGGSETAATSVASGNVSATFNLPDSNEPAAEATTTITVFLRDGSGGTLKASDSVTIFGIKSGSDSTTAFLTNSAHVVSTASNGSGASFTNAGGQFKVFVGSTDKTSNCTYTVQSETGVDISINAGTGAYTIGSMSADIGTAVLRATIPASVSPTGTGFTIDQTYTIAKSKAGDDGSSVTIGTPGTDSNGNTTIPITDGDGTTTLTISKGDDGTTQGVKVAYASDANGTNKSFTQGNLTFVKYVEYTGTAPAITNSVFNSGYVQFIGGDGTSEGVKPIYATDASGSSASFTQGSRTFVNFYEWTGSEPTSIPGSLTYVKFIGDDGADGNSVALVAIYKQQSYTAAVPTISGTSNYNFNNSTLTSIPSGWSTTIPTFSLYQSTYESEVAISGTGTSNTVTWPTPVLYNPFFDLNPKVFKRSTSQPDTPGVAATNPPTGWSATIPTGSTPVWESVGTWSYNTSGSTYSWSTPVKITGDTGAPGASAASLSVSSNIQTFGFDNSSDTTPTPSTATITVNQQNQASNLVTGDITVTNGTKSSFSYSGSNGTGAATVTVTPTGTYPITVAVSNDSLSDSVQITKVTGGDDGNNDPRSARTFIYNSSSATTPSNTTNNKRYNFETGVLASSAYSSPANWSASRPSRPYFRSEVRIKETTAYNGNQTITFDPAMRVGSIGRKDPGDFDIKMSSDLSKFEYSFDSGANFIDGAAIPTEIKNDQIVDSTGNIKDTIGFGLPGTTDVFSPTEFKNLRASFDNIGNSGTIQLQAGIVPIDDSNFFKVDSGEIKFGDNITYAGKITAGSGDNVAILDGANSTYRIYAGDATPADAKFSVTQTGAVYAEEVFIGSSEGLAMGVSTGTNRFQIRTPGSGVTGTVLEVGGDSNTTYTPFKVSNDGTGDLRGFNIFTSGGTKLFDASTGFTSEAFTEIAEATGASVSSISKTSSGDADSDSQKITISSSQTITVSAGKYALFSGIGIDHSGNSSQAISTAYSRIPNSVTVKVLHNTSNSRSGATQVGGTLSFSEYSSGTQSATQYRLDQQVETEPGFAFAEVELIRANHSNASMSQSFSASGSVGAGTASFATNGYFTLEFTHTISAGAHYYWIEIGGSGSYGTGTVGDVTDDSAVRVLTLTAASGSTFNVSGGDGSETSDDVNNNTITLAAGSGLTNGGDFTVNQAVNETITFNVGAGTGITVNANDIAVNTGAVVNGASTIPTSDHVYDFVTTQINNLIDGAPGTLNTLNELAAALDDDNDFHTAVTTSLNGKLSLTGGAMTGAITTNSTFDGRDVSVDGAKLDNIASNANNYSLPTASSGTKGGITTNFTTNSTARNYKVLMSGTNAYVNVPWTDTTGSNNFLDGITKSGNTLTFSVNGTTNQTYTFGSNAFNSTSYLPLTGGTISGALAITGTGTAGTPTFDIINSSSSTFNHTIEAMTPNMTANESNILVFGRESSTKNSGYIGYKYSSTASNNNVITIGHWGSNHLVTIDGVGNMDVASTLNAVSTITGGNIKSNTSIAAFGNGTTGFAGHGMEVRVIGGVGSLLSYNRTTSTQMPAEIGGSYVMFDVSGVEKGRFHTNGCFGIGTQNPLDLLHIKSSTTDARLVLDAAAGADPELKFFEAGNVKYTVGYDAATSKFVIGTSNVDTQKRFTINSSGAITFNEAFTFPTSIGTAGQVLKVPSSGTTLEWGTVSGGSGLPSGMTYSSSILDVTGAIRATGDVTAYHSSDARLKDNVVVIDSALAKVKQIRGVEFDWNDKQNVHEGHDIGVIAQDVEQVAPELVKDREDGYKAVDYPKLTALLIEAVKELELKVKELEDKQK